MHTIGIISDTHGSLPDEACDVFRGKYSPDQVSVIEVLGGADSKQFEVKPAKCDLILHAGDIGSQRAIYLLEQIAPVKAVLGNCDLRGYIAGVYEVERRISFVFDDTAFTMMHRPMDLRSAMRNDTNPRVLPDSAEHVWVHGHTHVPEIMRIENGVVIGPGSPTEPRGGSVPSVALLQTEPGGILISAMIIALA